MRIAVDNDDDDGDGERRNRFDNDEDDRERGNDSDPEFDTLIQHPVSPSHSLSPLPSLSQHPTVYPGCCIALSAPLTTSLCALLPPAPGLVLSIGSGTGLFEALLAAGPCNLDVVGVEVHPSVNHHLSPSRHRAVMGTRSLEPLAMDADVWLFVYPRRVALVDEYMAAYAHGAVRAVVWIGPSADWQDYRDCFGSFWDVQVRSAEELRGRAWETVAVATKDPTWNGEDGSKGTCNM